MKRFILGLMLLCLMSGCSFPPFGETHTLIGTVTHVEQLHYDVIVKEPFKECKINDRTGRQECTIFYQDRVDRQFNNFRVTYDANGFVGTIVTYRKYEIGDRFKVQVTVNPRGGVANHRQ